MGSIRTETVLQQPGLSYKPDFDQYQARTRFRLQTEPLQKKTLPEGFPKQLVSDLVWEGEGLADKYDWTYVLAPEQIRELEDALEHFKGEPKFHVSGRPLLSIGQLWVSLWGT